MWEGRVPSRNPLDGGLKVIETTLLDRRAHLCAEAAGFGCFVNNDTATRFLHGVDHGVSVPWNQCLEVDQFTINARILASGRNSRPDVEG